MITPKLDYIKTDSKRADSIQEIVMSPTFRRAAEVALLEYAMRLGEGPATGLKISGAKGFLEELLNVGIEFPTQPLPEDNQLSPV